MWFKTLESVLIKSFRRRPGSSNILNQGFLLFTLLLTLFNSAASAADYADIIARIKPGVVVFGTHMPLRQPAFQFRGTGFVIADGRHLLTNAHNIPDELDVEKNEQLAIVVPYKEEKNLRLATVIGRDKRHDLALLKLSDSPLPALNLVDSSSVKEGQEYLFSGFPIGGVLGYRAVTHRAMVSAITPVVTPVNDSRQINANLLKRMRSPYDVFQLDATAYPGNSGSPLFDPQTGNVIGVINSVYVKESKESVIERPSGITYAIPISFAKPLIEKAGLSSFLQ